MDDVQNHKHCSLPYDAFLTKMFEHFRVSFRDQHDQHISENISTYMTSRGIEFDLTNSEKNIERAGTDNQHLIDIDNSSNVEDIPSDPSAQPQRSSSTTRRTSITRRSPIARKASCVILGVLWAFKRYNGTYNATLRIARNIH